MNVQAKKDCPREMSRDWITSVTLTVVADSEYYRRRVAEGTLEQLTDAEYAKRQAAAKKTAATPDAPAQDKKEKSATPKTPAAKESSGS